MTTETKTGTPSSSEKPHHYSYLKEFRVDQCPLFLQHKCTQHRPFTCFHWHFMNQRRRRPSRKRDGAFNYSPDVYCTNYDETTGICPDGDECPLLHRTAGDTERRYHLRYYKTAPCVHETDSRGHCVKNGVHCAFSHGVNDLRPPIYDVREIDAHNKENDSLLPNNLDRDRALAEDPKWQCTTYVLTNYKTEQCKRPPRLCRQGYACPQYHNNKDRRRSPKTFKYRSTPCPNVKHGDEWGEPTNCESGDQCAYCHTRTEQQFHPEIYKSTKCNDMLQTGYCPRGPFCAFAHIDEEINSFRDSMSDNGSDDDHSLAGYFNNVLPSESGGNPPGNSSSESNTVSTSNKLVEKEVEIDVFNMATVSPQGGSGNGVEITSGMRREILAIENDANINALEKSQRKQEVFARRHLSSTGSLSSTTSSCGLQHALSLSSSGGGGPITRHQRLSSTSSGISSSSALGGSGSPQNNTYFSMGDTVESVLANGLDDLDIDDLNIENLDKEIEHGGQDQHEEPNSASSSFSASFGSPMGLALGRSLPISIPSDAAMLNRPQFPSSGGGTTTSGPPGFGDVSNASTTSGGAGSMSPLSAVAMNVAAMHQPRQRAYSLGQYQQHQSSMQQHLRDSMTVAAFLSQPNPGKFGAPASAVAGVSPGSGNGVNSSPLLSSSLFSMPQGVNKSGSLPEQGSGAGNIGAAELLRLHEEVISSRSTLAAWEECMMQARKACDAWKKEAEESKMLMGKAETDKIMAMKQRDDAVTQCSKLLQELDRVGVTNQHMKCLKHNDELDKISIQQVLLIQQQLRGDLERVEKLLYHHHHAGVSQAPPPGFAPQQSQAHGVQKPPPSNTS